MCILRLGLGNVRDVSAFGRLWKTSDFFGRLRNSLGIFGNDGVIFKNPSTLRIKIARLYLRKSWQVYVYRKKINPFEAINRMDKF